MPQLNIEVPAALMEELKRHREATQVPTTRFVRDVVERALATWKANVSVSHPATSNPTVASWSTTLVQEVQQEVRDFLANVEADPQFAPLPQPERHLRALPDPVFDPAECPHPFARLRDGRCEACGTEVGRG